MLSRAANFEYLHVPFQGTAPSIQSLLGGQIASCISPIGSFVPRRPGRGAAGAGNDRRRVSRLGNGWHVGHQRAALCALEFAEWFGIFVPARTPSGTVETLSSVLRTVLQAKEVRAGLANQSVDVAGHTPADFDRWGPIVKASGFTPLD
jgi:tripartite-type tricarboxylate transporter receptor subunit TctC